MSMNILLQNRRTLNFLGATIGWTSKHAEARIFGTGLEAMLFCLNHQVADMQILGKFADQRMDFTVPVTDLRGGENPGSTGASALAIAAGAERAAGCISG